MIFAKEGMIMFEGNEPLILAELESILTSFYVNARNIHGEDIANELFAEVGRRAIEGVEDFEKNAEHIDRRN